MMPHGQYLVQCGWYRTSMAPVRVLSEEDFPMFGFPTPMAYGTPKDLISAVRAGTQVTVNGQNVGVVDYLNLGHKDSAKTKAAWAFKDFLLGLRSKPGSVPVPTGVELVHVFSGKATIAELNKVFNFIDDRIDAIAAAKDLPGWPAGRSLKQIIDAGEDYLQRLSDVYCGYDCNGYVGLFLYEKTSLPNNIGPDTSIGTYFTMGGEFRASIADVEANDIIVWSNKSHIAIVSDVSQPAGHTRSMGIAQSTGKSPRTGDEGPQFEQYLVSEAGKHGKHMEYHVHGAIVGGNVQIISLGL
jgi:hypothetical protein